MATSSGNCFICGKTAGKTATKNHILKEHDSGDEPCYLFKAEGFYDKGYWLFFSVPLSAHLSSVDSFLRNIWCECCGHLSAFRVGNSEIAMSQKISSFSIGDVLLYEYDFGTPTEIIVTVLGNISRNKQRENIQLLARNVPPEGFCVLCNAKAVMVGAFQGELYCGECADDIPEDNEVFLQIVNSPRSGACGYSGELDVWIFDPARIHL